MNKGTITPLLHTKKSRERILVAIQWDLDTTKETFVQKIRGNKAEHDLDVSCFVFDKNGEYIDFVGSMAQDAMDSTGCIYHSGDDATGEGDGDDESISCELAGLPASTTDLIFVTEIRSAHVFSQIHQPYARIADGMSNDNLFELTMAVNDGQDKTACIMARITRDKTSPTGWSLHSIDEYPDLAEVADWGTYLTRYL